MPGSPQGDPLTLGERGKGRLAKSGLQSVLPRRLLGSGGCQQTESGAGGTMGAPHRLRAWRAAQVPSPRAWLPASTPPVLAKNKYRSREE